MIKDGKEKEKSTEERKTKERIENLNVLIDPYDTTLNEKGER